MDDVGAALKLRTVPLLKVKVIAVHRFSVLWLLLEFQLEFDCAMVTFS
jgi:hypothetical protein